MGRGVVEKTGRRFGRLKVLGDSGLRASNRSVIWGCLCDCGNLTLVPLGSRLYKGKTKSCGCFRRERAAEFGRLSRKYSKTEAKRRRLIGKRRYRAKQIMELANDYIKNLLTKDSILVVSDIPSGLIKLKRAQIVARRLLKERRYNEYKT